MNGLPWLLEGVGTDVWDYKTHLEILNDTMGITYFENANFTMKVLYGNTVSFRYKFRGFQGEAAVFAPWEALLETRCQRLNTTLDVEISLTSNTTEYQGKDGELRWINVDRRDARPREEPIQLCECLRSSDIISWLK